MSHFARTGEAHVTQAGPALNRPPGAARAHVGASSLDHRPQRVGLVLGSGSARGWAHIGVLQACEELAIRIDCVAGTSIGALVGAVYASRGIEQLKEIVLHLDKRQLLSLLDVGLRHAGLIDGKRVADGLRERIYQPLIEQLNLPYRAVATDLNTGDEIVLDRGDIIEAVRASISIPGVFTPVVRDDRILVDGGLTNPVPVSLARALGADFVIAVDVNHRLLAGYSARKRGEFTPSQTAGGRGTSAAAAMPEPESERESKQESQRESKRESKQESKPELKSEPESASADKPALPGFLQDVKRLIRAEVIKKNRALAYLNQQLDRIHLPEFAHLKAWTDREGMPSMIEVIFTSTAIMEARIGDYRLKLDPPDLLICPRVGHIRGHEFDRGEEAIVEGYRAAMEALGPLQKAWWPLEGEGSKS